MTLPLRKIAQGHYTVNAVGRTWTLMQITERHESVTPWAVLDDDERPVLYSTTRAAAVSDLLARLSR